MSPTQKLKSQPTLNSRGLLLPYGIAILAQFPMLILYCRELWIRPHYQFAPLAILATLLIVYLRRPDQKSTARVFNAFSGSLLVCGLLSSVASLAFLSPWFAAVSLFFIVASYLSTIPDNVGIGSLCSASLPILAVIYLPNGLDSQLLSWLHMISSELASQALELGGMSHYLSYSTIEIPGTTFPIESSSRGLPSIFILAFAACLLAAWNRRSLFHLGTLLVCAMVLALLMNTVRIAAIPLADRFISFDLSAGLAHRLFGYFVLAFCLFLLLSVDQFLVFLFGPIEDSTGRSGPFGNTLTYLWNHVIAGDVESRQSERRRRDVKPIGSMARYMVWGTAGILALVGAVQTFDIFRSYNRSDLAVQFFTKDVTQPFSRDDMPENLVSPGLEGTRVSWEKSEYVAENRTAGSDLGNRSDTWIYTNRQRQLQTSVSLDQTFPGWHELTVCYQNDGWKMVERTAKTASIEIDGETVEWPYIEAHFKKPTGQEGFLLFSHFDAQGQPLSAPSKWGLNSFFIRVKNRLNHRIRGSLFQSEAYQSQLFIVKFGEISDTTKELVRSQYLVARGKLRAQFLAKRNDDGPSNVEQPGEAAGPTNP